MHFIITIFANFCLQLLLYCYNFPEDTWKKNHCIQIGRRVDLLNIFYLRFFIYTLYVIICRLIVQVKCVPSSSIFIFFYLLNETTSLVPLVTDILAERLADFNYYSMSCGLIYTLYYCTVFIFKSRFGLHNLLISFPNFRQYSRAEYAIIMNI